MWKVGQIKSPSTTAFYRDSLRLCECWPRGRGVVMCSSGYEDSRVSALPYGCAVRAIVLGAYLVDGTLVSSAGRSGSAANLSVVNPSTVFYDAYGKLMAGELRGIPEILVRVGDWEQSWRFGEQCEHCTHVLHCARWRIRRGIVHLERDTRQVRTLFDARARNKEGN